MMPISSLRRGFCVASRTWPPAWLDASSTVDVMAALGGDTRRLQAAGTGADDHHLALGPSVFDDDVRHRRLAAGRRIVDAQRLAALVDAVEAIGGADAGADLVLAALHHLRHDVRIGDVGAGHADHVELAGGDGVARGGDVGDTRRVEDRELRRRPHLAGEVEMRRRTACPGSG